MAHVAFDSWLNAAMIVASREAMLNQADYLAEGEKPGSNILQRIGGFPTFRGAGITPTTGPD
jgi:hypothetical protein